MPKPFDATTRTLLEIDPRSWLACAGIEAAGPVRLVDSDVSTVTAGADSVIRVGEPGEYLAHVESQAGHDRALPGRLLHYNVLLNYRHDLPVRSIAVLLRREVDSPGLDGLHRVLLPDGASYLDFRYSVVRVWTLDVESVLRGGLGTLPLAPLTAVTEDALPGVIARMRERLDREASGERAGLLWAATNILLGLKYPAGLAERLLQGVQAMEESSTYQAILEKGRAKGRDEGRVEGEIKILLRMGRNRLGPPEPGVVAAIEAIRDEAVVAALADRLFEVSSWAELLG